MSFTHGRVCDITEDAVKSWYYGNALKDQPDAKERTYQMLKRICKKAVEDGLLEKQPCTLPHVHRAKSKRHDVPVITNEELRTITDNMPEWCRIFQYTAAMLGLRISEVCALQRQDFDLPNRRVHISHGLNRGEGDRGLYAWPRPKQKAPTHGSIFHKASCPCSLNGCERTSDQSRMQCSSKARQVATI